MVMLRYIDPMVVLMITTDLIKSISPDVYMSKRQSTVIIHGRFFIKSITARASPQSPTGSSSCQAHRIMLYTT
jgi:hypothetical protein